MNKTEQFQKKLRAQSDEDLIQTIKDFDSKMREGKNAYTMSIPPRITDTDLALSELIRRYEEVSNLLKRADGLVGNPATNISASTDLACEQWRKDYEQLTKTEEG